MYGLHMLEYNFSEPHSFIPERWLKPSVEKVMAPLPLDKSAGGSSPTSTLDGPFSSQAVAVPDQASDHRATTSGDKAAADAVCAVTCKGSALSPDASAKAKDAAGKKQGNKEERERPIPYVGPRQQASYVPFSMGPRSCIGQRLATMEVSYILLRLKCILHSVYHISLQRGLI